MTLLNQNLPENRRGKLKALLRSGQLVRVLEAHNGLSGIVADTTCIEGKSGEQTVTREFDAIWESSLTDSASKGHPDIEVISFDSRLHTIQEILAVTQKPMIVDGDTGGDPNTFEYMVSKMERAGVSAVIIEDKVFPKRNSLEGGTSQALQEPEVFAQKIKRGKKVQATGDFMIIARIESLIAGTGMEDALHRARTYLLAGVDGIMIHSKSKQPDEIMEFARAYRSLLKELEMEKPLVCVPTTYNNIVEDELQAAGFNIVIYANHLLRAAYKAMRETAQSILSHQRSFEADPQCAPVREIFGAVGFLDVKEKDQQDAANTNIPVIIPAAGDAPAIEPVLKGTPKAMADIAGKTLLARQIQTLNQNNLTDITVVTGYGADRMKNENAQFVHYPDYNKGSELHSLLAAQNKMANGFIMLYSDILLENQVLSQLLSCKEDIVLVLDNSIQYMEPVAGKATDYVISRNRPNKMRRNINFDHQNTLAKIGKKIDPGLATHEFIGLAKFTRTGAEQFLQTYQDAVKNLEGKVQEAEDISQFRLTDLLQEMIDRGFNVHYLEIHKGWLEIHFPRDIELANELYIAQDHPSEVL
ncbi:MAG: phosphoenolpyruvate mutase [Nitrospinaceae bacterium]|nr:phosphoenolpyruvate mutase [Nitrospinaceae bacterium]NIR53240.1 phosphoenolpyruvate mutase [Nitrospinaceae bacterium]NIS83638.1 phosphoenolpyruvate mutase [Nitrospinaceae bacterium]NIT80429.1 phosphoenolpyruvate mutase [Nitrospinaceae bacterium]NIU42767.1 phosphoenolpyruvate mutase [Nitrospinaceae bacterium]